MRFYIPILFVLLMSFFMQGCSRKSISSFERKGIVVSRSGRTVGSVAAGDSLQIQYLGCGGLYIKHHSTGIMIDPFFSNQSFMKIGRSIFMGSKIKPKKSNILFGKQRILDSLHMSPADLQIHTRAIFNAHGHYDHLLDIPFIFHHWFNRNIDVYVNESAYNSCANVMPGGKLHRVEPIMSVRDQPGSNISFASANGAIIKVYPILAAHNPHAYHIKLFSGSVMDPVKNFTDPEAKTRINNWLEGRTLSFLIDIERGDSIACRIFVQSSSCHLPDGLPPQLLLDQKPVDLAILGVASYHYSEATYPCGYLQALRAATVMYIHWEDFFRSYKREPKSLLKNDVVRFFKEVAPRCTPARYLLPVPGVVVNLKY